LAGRKRPAVTESPAYAASSRAGRLVERLRDPGLVAAAAAAAAPLLAAAATLWLVIPTLMPGVASWDTAEFQAVGPVLGTGHPTGYPSYVIVGWIGSHILPFGDPAYRMNLLQAVLAAVAVAGTVAVVQILTGQRWVALAAGLLLAWSKLFWGLATHADYHMFHLALVALVFAALVAWERRRVGRSEVRYDEARWLLAAAAAYGVAIAALGLPWLVPIGLGLALWCLLFVAILAWEAFARTRTEAHSAPQDAPPGRSRLGDRWLIAAALIFGVAVANHGLAWLLPPAIGLFVLAVDPRVFLRWRTILACAGVLAATVAILYAEMPIRAAMHAPLVYGHPDTWAGFKYVVFGEQFGTSLHDPFGNLAFKAGHAVDLLAGWLGPVGYLAVAGFITSLYRRPRYVLLSGLAAVVTCVFAESYANAVIERYYLVPLFVAFTWVGLGAADLVSLAAWLAARIGSVAPGDIRWRRQIALGLELVAAVVLIVSMVGIVPQRQQPGNNNLAPGGPPGVNLANDRGYDQWLRAVLAPADRGGLPEGSVIMGWWSASTTLWYGQRVEGLRPDIVIIDDSDRVNDNLGDVWDVFDRYLGNRPVFTIRLDGNLDGMRCLRTVFSIAPYPLPGGNTIDQVKGRLMEGPPKGPC
jgi:hypothetical protein